MTVLSGVVHGYLDGRWSKNEDMIAKGSRLEELPENIGDWELATKSSLKPKAAQILRCHGSVVRHYRHQVSGATVNIAVLFGPRGPIAVHTPEICYSSIGTNLVDERQVTSIECEGDEHKFWAVQFAVDPLPDPSLEVWYAWSDGGQFEARENPRYWLTENLYKIQVAGPVGDSNNGPVKELVTALLPYIKEAINE